MSAERAAMDMLHWTRDMKEARDIAYEVADNYARLFKGLQQPVEGLKSWLDAIAAAKVPCAVVSSLDRCAHLKKVLARIAATLGTWFTLYFILSWGTACYNLLLPVSAALQVHATADARAVWHFTLFHVHGDSRRWHGGEISAAAVSRHQARQAAQSVHCFRF